MDNVEMIYENSDKYSEFTYSYLNKKTGEYFIYCHHCKKFEKMGALINQRKFKENKKAINRSFSSLRLISYYNDILIDEKYEQKHKNVILLEERLKYYTSEKIAEFTFDTNFSIPSFIILKRKIKYYVCEKCNSKYEFEKIFYFNINQNKPHDYLYGVKIFKEEGKNGPLIKIINLHLEYGIWNNTIITNRYREKLTLNVETGMSYLIGKKRIDGTKKNYRTMPIRNITYHEDYRTQVIFNNSRHFHEEAFKALFKAVYNEKTKRLGHEPDGYRNIDLDRININDRTDCIIRMNRFPNVPHNAINDLLKIVDGYIISTNKKMYKLKDDKVNWVDCIIKIYELKNTNFVKRLLRKGHNPNYIQLYMSYIKEPNNVLKILESNFVWSKTIFTSDLFADMIEKYGETITVNKMIQTKQYYILSDTVNMYNQIKRALGSYPLIGTIRELHDNLSKDIAKIDNPNYEFSYTKDEKQLEDHNEDYDLVFAKTAHELIDVGSEMRICVGSYGKKAFKKRCNIIVLRNKKEKPIVCIELSGDCKSIVQAKYFANNILPKKEFDYINSWLEKHKLTIATKDLNSYEVNEKVISVRAFDYRINPFTQEAIEQAVPIAF